MNGFRGALVALVAGAALVVPAAATAADTGLDAYRVKATAKNIKALAKAGFDVTEGRNRKTGLIEVVGTKRQITATKLEAERVEAKSSSGTRRGAGEADPTAGASDADWVVWTKYDAVDGDDKEQYTEQYARLVEENPGLVAKRVTGTTYNGREIIALQVTKDATGADIPGRPAVLYNAQQHAREWLAGETCRRTLEYFVTNYGKGTSAGREVTPLVDNNELWFVCINNPDGFEFTFTPGNRLWRKNLRDNNNDGTIAVGDGVDPNRNFSSNWGLDDDGSSPEPASETYRGPSPASEPETKAMEALFAEIHPVFQKNDHTAAELLLYPQGFQQDTPTADHEIFEALAGDPFKPGIEGFLPELSAGLYITNGDFTDWAYSHEKTLSYTPEGTSAEDPNVTGFEYADSPLQVRQEFQRHLPFILDLAKSADDPTEPESHLGNTAADFTVDSFAYSYGDPQQVQATVKRKLGDVTMRFRINGGETLSVPTKEFTGGERYFKNDAVYYHRVRGFVSGTQPNDKVEVWFTTAGGKASDHFTYTAVSESNKPVLLLSNEDWSGKIPNPAPLAGPTYLEEYKALLNGAGVAYDVYDVDCPTKPGGPCTGGRVAPDELGILSHYSHVVWYTGDDQLVREPDAPGGSGMSKLGVDTQNRVRDFVNEGGKLFFTGEFAGTPFTQGYVYNPFQAEENGAYCNTSDQCIAVQDDFLQYYLGANRYMSDLGSDPDGNPYGVKGFNAPFVSGPFELVPSHTAGFLVTSSVYDPATYPQWTGSQKALGWDRPGSPFDPFTGDWFASAGGDDGTYKRLSRSVDLTGKTSATLSFRTSFDIETDYDYMFVEIHTVGQNDWTTLEEKNGHTTQGVGYSCPSTGPLASNWQSLHPFLARYQTKTPDGSDCTPTGTTGAWWAATGNSGGWQLWELDIPAAYLGKNVQIAITMATDPGSLGLGQWVDDTTLTTNTGELFSTSFEAGFDGWSTPAPPPGTVRQEPTWTRQEGVPFVEAAATTTPDTVYTGFGLEKVVGQANQVTLLKEAITHLGTPAKPAFSAPTPTKEPPAGGGGGGGGGVTPPPAVVPPALVPKGPLVAIAARDLRASRTGVVKLRLGCPKAALTQCRSTVRLASGKRRLGSKTATIRPGQTSTVSVKLSRTARRLLARRKRLRVQVTVDATDAANVRGTSTRRVTLRPAKARR